MLPIVLVAGERERPVRGVNSGTLKSMSATFPAFCKLFHQTHQDLVFVQKWSDKMPPRLSLHVFLTKKKKCQAMLIHEAAACYIHF